MFVERLHIVCIDMIGFSYVTPESKSKKNDDPIVASKSWSGYMTMLLADFLLIVFPTLLLLTVSPLYSLCTVFIFSCIWDFITKLCFWITVRHFYNLLSNWYQWQTGFSRRDISMCFHDGILTSFSCCFQKVKTF